MSKLKSKDSSDATTEAPAKSVEKASKKVITKPSTTKKKEEITDGNIQKSAKNTLQADGKEKVAKKAEAQQQAAESTVQETAAKTAEKPIAKAGKRSAKALKEAEDKQVKEARKAEVKAAEAESKPAAPKQKQRTAEDRLKARGKKYREAHAKIDHTKPYNIKEALKMAAASSPAKFDATVELHIRLGVDPKQADQNIRGTVALPAGTGKTLRIAVFADADGVQAAKKAGADIAAGEEFLQQLDKGQMNFDVLIAMPAMMPRLGKYARTLGPKGLMPNPKSGTVTKDVAKAVNEAKAGRVEYRLDSAGIVHVGIGKVSFGADKLFDNARAVLTSIKSAKPASVKGNYVLSVYTATSMGPSIHIDTADANSI